MLQIVDINAAYGDIKILKGVTLEIREGEIVCLLGANGAGKSTLLRVVSGILRPSQGKVFFRGRDITRFSPSEIVRLGISHVPEGRQIFSKLTVMQNLLLGGYTQRRKRAEARKVFDFAYNLFPVLKERLKI